MCMSCGCGSPNDDHGDSRNITLNDLDQAAQAAGTSVGQVSQNISNGWSQMASASGERGLPDSSSQQSQQGSAGQTGDQQTDTSAWQQQNQTQPQRQPGQYAASPGQESGTDWQESQQAGYTGQTGVQTPPQQD
jgi:hypothetical protein